MYRLSAISMHKLTLDVSSYFLSNRYYCFQMTLAEILGWECDMNYTYTQFQSDRFINAFCF